MTTMHLAHARAYDEDMTAEWHVVVPTRPTLATLQAPVHAPRYGEQRRPNLLAIAIIVALHAAAICALMMFDVIPTPRARPSELKIVNIADLAPPPVAEAAPPPPETPPAPAAATTPIVAPPPIVASPAPPAAVATVAVAAPVIERAEAAPAAPAAPIIAAAIVAPNGTAASLKNPAPRYPTESRRKREEGVVRLRVVITVDGRVRDIAIARSSGHERLDEAALDTVRRWRFLPGMQAGAAIEAVGFLNIPFQIKA